MLPTTADIVRALARIEDKLDTLIRAIAEDEEPTPTTIDGQLLAERDASKSLD